MGVFRRRSSRISPLGNNRFRIDLPKTERTVMAHVVGQLRALLTDLDTDDERVRRLFPTTYVHDPEAEAEYRRFMRTELTQSKLAALDHFESTITADEASEEQLIGWMQSVNSVRLVLGTMLDIGEDHVDIDPDDPNVDGYVLYHHLSGLLEEIVTALSGP
jgi:hypothetical protein